MCVLKRNLKSPAEVARWFRADLPRSINAPAETLIGSPGLTITEQGGRRALRQMNWGFPGRTANMRPGAKPKPVNQAADLSRRMWAHVAPDPAHRCLIPITDFAEPEGPAGAMTRTWFSVAGQEQFAWAGLWRTSSEWGDVYAGVTTAANEAIKPVQDRMPVLLLPDDWDRWLHGSIADVLAFQQRIFPAELIHAERTDVAWVERAPPQADPQFSLF